MKIEITCDELSQLVKKQLDHLFMLRKGSEETHLQTCLEKALERTDFCFKNTTNKYYHKDEQTYFNPFHSGQYCAFLYFLSNTIFQSNPEHRSLADRVYFLNKTLNAVDLFYEVELPEIFVLDHPVGTVLGRAKYNDFFSCTQNCTVGNNKGTYPTIGRNVKMLSGSKLIGNSTIGDNVILSSNTYIKDTDIPSCSIVFGSSPNLIVKSKDQSYFNPLF